MSGSSGRETGASSLREDRATDAPHGAPDGSPPSGPVSTGAVTFDGWALPGAEVAFIGRNGYDWQLEEAMGLFTVGQRLTVAARKIGDWSSSYQFEGFGNKHFNTVMFAHDCDADAPEGSPS